MDTPTTVTKKSSSFSIREAIQRSNDALEAILLDNYGEIDEEAENIIENIDGLEEIAEEKINRIGWFIESLQEAKADAEGRRSYFYDRYKQYQKSKKRFSKAIKRMEGYIISLINVLGGEPVTSEGRKLYISTSHKLIVTDKMEAIDNLPDEFIKVKKSVDKKALKKHLKNNQNVNFPGVSLEGSDHLRGF